MTDHHATIDGLPFGALDGVDYYAACPCGWKTGLVTFAEARAAAIEHDPFYGLT